MNPRRLNPRGLAATLAAALILAWVFLMKPEGLRRLSADDEGVLRIKSGMAEGLNVATPRFDQSNCLIFKSSGEILRTLSGTYCIPLPGAGLLRLSGNDLTVFDDKLESRWRHRFRRFGDDLNVSFAQSEIAALDTWRTELPWDLGNIQFHDIKIFDYRGELKFSWSESEHIDELTAAVKDFGISFEQFGEGLEISRMNSVEIVPPGLEARNGPAFRAGHILVSLGKPEALLVIDRISGKIVWTFQEETYGDGIASARFTPEGDIVYLRNHARGSASEVVLLSAKTKKIVWQFAPGGHGIFYAEKYGSVQALPNGNFLVTHNPHGGHAFEITREKKIIWEWTRPLENHARPLLGRVTRYPESYFEDLNDLIR